MNFPAVFRARPRSFHRRRSVLIPVAVIIATAAVYAGNTVIPQLISPLLSPIGQHARIVPDNAELFISIDLKKAGTPNVQAILNPPNENENGFIQDAVQTYTGLSEPPPGISTWAGRELSISTFPDAGYAIVIDVRNSRAAAVTLDSFIAKHPQSTLLKDHLVITSSPATAAPIIDRIDDRHRNTLKQTTDYQQAERLRDSRRPAAVAFLRWSIIDGKYARSYAALLGCDTSGWLSATADIKDDEIQLLAHCPPTEGLTPPATLDLSSAPPKAQHPPDGLYYNASFRPSLEFVYARTRNTGHPEFTLLDFIVQLAVGPTGYRITDVDQQVLQHLAGNVQLAIEDDNTEAAPAFRITLGIKPEHRQPLDETVAAIATSMASTHGIQTARPSADGWLLRHPAAPTETISLTTTELFITATNRPEYFPAPSADDTNSDANRPRYPNPQSTPAHATLNATGSYAALILAYGFPPLAEAAASVWQIDYSFYNDGAVLIHRANLTLQTPDADPQLKD